MAQHSSRLPALPLDADDRRVVGIGVALLGLGSAMLLVLALVLGVSVRLFLAMAGLHG